MKNRRKKQTFEVSGQKVNVSQLQAYTDVQWAWNKVFCCTWPLIESSSEFVCWTVNLGFTCLWLSSFSDQWSTPRFVTCSTNTETTPIRRLHLNGKNWFLLLKVVSRVEQQNFQKTRNTADAETTNISTRGEWQVAFITTGFSNCRHESCPCWMCSSLAGYAF